MSTTTAPAEVAPPTTAAENRVAVATQRQLIWWRFRKHRLAVISAMIVAGFYLVAAFADTIAYAEPFETEAARSYIPPQPIHWFDAEGHFHPHEPRAADRNRQGQRTLPVPGRAARGLPRSSCR